MFETAIPKIPRGLNPIGKRHWKKITEQLPRGVLAKSDGLALEMMCGLWAVSDTAAMLF